MQHRLTLAAVILTIKLFSAYADNADGIPTECPQVDPMNTTIHLAHEFDCSKFYACSNGRKILMMCPLMDGNGNKLHFNPKLQVCDWPNHAGCNVSTSTTTLVTESTINLNTDNSTESIETTVSLSTESTEAGNSSKITETTTESSWSSSEQSTVASSTEGNIISSSTSTDSTPQNTDRPSESMPITTEESTVSSTTVTIAQTTVPSQSTAHITNKPPVPSSTVTEAETSVTPQSTTHISEPTSESTTSPSESTPVTTSKPSVPSFTVTEAETSVTPSPITAEPSNTSSAVTDQPSVSSSTVTVAATSVPSQSTTHIPELTSENTASPSESTPVTTSKPSVPSSTTTEPESSVISQSTEYVTDSSPQSTTGSSELTSVTTGNPTVPSSSITESTSHTTTFSPTSTLQTSSSPDKTTNQSTMPTTQSTESSTFLTSSITHNSTNTPAIITTNQTEITTTTTTTTNITIPTQITTSQTETTTIQITTNPTIITTDDFNSNETTSFLPTPLPECTSNVSGILYPHESNCSLFYECNHGDLVLLDCPEGLYFNASRQICVWPHETNCQQLSSSNSSTTVSAILSTTETPSANISILCPADNSKDGVLYPHECVCSKFYTCTNGQLVLSQCPTGLDFNPRLDTCDWPENAKCQLSLSSSHVSSTTESLTTNIPVESAKPIVQNSTQSDNLVDQSSVSTSIPVEIIKPIKPNSTHSNTFIDQSSVSKSECPEDGSDSQIPHETNCRLYYECKDGEKLLKECSSGLEFNPLLQVCDWPEYAGCSQPQSTQGTTTEKIVTSAPVVESTTPIIQSSTQKNETSTPKIQSSTPEFETSTSIAETSTPSSEKCLRPCPENDPIDYTVLVENENCSKFCKCSHGIPYVLNCPPGLYFDSLQQTCDYPERANCITVIITIIFGIIALGSTIKTTTENNCIGKCPDENFLNASILLAHVNCTKYCHCNQGKAIVKNCESNLMFNFCDGICDKPKNVKCRSDQIGSDGTPNSKDDQMLWTIVVLNGIASASEIDYLQLNDPFNSVNKIDQIAYDCYGECPRNELRKVFLLANQDKTKYCRCIYGLPYLRKCHSNWVFSLEEAECIDPSKSISTNNLTGFIKSLWKKTSSVFDSRDNSLSASVQRINDGSRCIGKCSKDIAHVAMLLAHEDCSKFCQCKNGHINVKTCRDNMEFDYQEASCVPHGTAHCKSESTKPVPSYNCIGTCPHDLSGVATLLAHDDCLKYCVCKKGIPYIRDCPPGYHFDFNGAQCLEPEVAKCDRLNGIVSNTVDCIGTCTNATDVNKVCLLAHKDCHKYCVCKNLNVTVHVCENNLYFHLKTQRCTSKEEAGCLEPLPPPTSTPPPPPPPPGCLGVCPTEPIANATCSTPHTDCTKYCLCDNGNSIVKDCPKGLHFSVKEGICVDPKIAECEVPEPPNEGCLSLECDADPNKACIIKHSNCTKYCICYNGTITINPCPNGEHYNFESRKCDKPENAGCDNSITPIPPLTCDQHTCSLNSKCLWPTNECTQYCDCRNGVTTIENCPQNLHFNPISGICQDPLIAGCGSSIPTIPSPPIPVLIGCLEECKADNDPEKICFQPNEDCKKYCTCRNGTKMAYDCPKGLHFSKDKKECVDPAIAGCVPYNCIGQCPNYDSAACLLMHGDCTKYCHCIRGAPIVKNCDSGHFSLDLARCDNPNVVKCDRINGTVNSHWSSWRSNKITSNRIHNRYAKKIISENCIGNCPQEDITDVAVVLPHKNCSKYCHCINRRAYAESCPSDLRFSVHNATCISPQYVECNIMIASTTVLIIVTSQPIDSNRCMGKCPLSNNRFDNPTLLAHEDCTKYCFCQNGCPTVKTCPERFHFSWDERMCLPIGVAKCDDRINCLRKCPFEHDEKSVLLYAHENRGKYCHCHEWGIVTVENCPESLIFDPGYGFCKAIEDCNNTITQKPHIWTLWPNLSTSTVAPKNDVSTTPLDISVTVPPVDDEPKTPVYHPAHSTSTLAPKNDVSTTPLDISVTVPPVDDEPKTPVYHPAHSTSTLAPKNDVSTTPLDMSVTVPPVDDEPKTPVYHPAHSTSTLAPKNDVSTTPLDMSVTVPPVDDEPKTPVYHPAHSTSTLAPKNDVSTTPLDISVTVPPVDDNLRTPAYHPKHSTSTLAPKNDDSTTPLDLSVTVPPVDDEPTTPGCPHKHSTSTLAPNNHGSSTETKNCSCPETPKTIKISNGVDGCIGYCPPENDRSYTEHLPHGICKLYCKCDWGIPTVMECPKKLHFNRNLKICDYPEDAKCSGIGGFNRFSTIQFLFVGFICGITAASEVCIGKCPVQSSLNGSVIFLPNVNCSKYCVCDHGRPIEMPCPANLHFSTENNTCADPEQANCIDVTPITNPTSEESEQEYDNFLNYLHNFESNNSFKFNSKPGIRYNTYCANPTVDCRDKPLSCIGKCPTDHPQQIYLLAHEDCTKYCICQNYMPVTKLCSQDLHFSIDDAMCLEPEKALCDGVNGYITTTTTTTTTTPSPSYKCTSECPFYDNPDLIILVAHEICGKYCHCKNGIGEPKDCPLNSHFSLLHGTCVDPDIAQCPYANGIEKPTPVTPESETPATPESETPATPKPVTPATPEPVMPVTPEPDKSGCIGTCPSYNNPTYTAQLPHEDCNKFCKCDWGQPVVLDCPPSLFYNPNLLVCDYPYAAGCTGNIQNFDTYDMMKKFNINENYRKENVSSADCVKPCPLTNPPNSTVHVAHKNCTKFCKCSYGTAWVMDCPKNLYFNPKEQVCDFKFNVHCNENGPWVDEKKINKETMINKLDTDDDENSIWRKFKRLLRY
ncbi:uncharacterized protein LOC130672278 [Microplitis mediator]|uniref:uncharacterized protein LOC130672278 n=1 Tax=Microplitis mediator TaxID=375433 RepID=UPI0025549667|nr:uncharacterized protein LOC130672278 [Microplitis mediator]